MKILACTDFSGLRMLVLIDGYADLDQDIENCVSEKAKNKGANLQFLVNDLLRKDISLIKKKKVTG